MGFGHLHHGINNGAGLHTLRCITEQPVTPAHGERTWDNLDKGDFMKDTKIQWHPGFVAAMNLEFAEDRAGLIFEKEYNLNTKP